MEFLEKMQSSYSNPRESVANLISNSVNYAVYKILIVAEVAYMQSKAPLYYHACTLTIDLHAHLHTLAILTCKNTCIHTCIKVIHSCVHTHSCLHVLMCADAHKIPPYMHIYIYTYVCVFTFTNAHTMCTCIRCTCKTGMYMNICGCMHVCSLLHALHSFSSHE